MLRSSLLTGCLVLAAVSPVCANERPFDQVDWCSDGFDQKATFKVTDKGLELAIGSNVELLDFDGGTTVYGALIATSKVTKKDVYILPGELVYGHDGENKKRVVIIKDRVFMSCDGQ